MANMVTMPKLGFDMAEGTLLRWVKLEGDPVAHGEVLAEIETDKATVEVESGFSGVVFRHLVEEGTSVPIGQPIAVIAEPGEKVDEAALTQPAAEGQPQKTEPEAPAAPKPETSAPAPGDVHATPLARRIAREQGINLALVHGSGPGGRIVRKDLDTAAVVGQGPVSTPVTARVASAAPVPAPVSPAGSGLPNLGSPTWEPGTASLKEETIPLEKLRIAIGRRMQTAKQVAPHFYVTHNYDVAALMELREQVNQSLPDGQKISVNDFIVKAVALTLRQFPNLNASLEGESIHRHAHINVGIAVAVKGGLLTVVCRDADQKPMRLISSEVRELTSRARAGKVKPDDIEGSTFSISNLGMFGVEEFSAILNPPEAGILAVGSAAVTPVVVDGEVRVGMRMKATISVDHRVSDGAEAAQFMQSLAQFIEHPLTLLL